MDIKQIYQKIVSSIDYDDISFKEDEGVWVSSISIHFKAANRYMENFKAANPRSIVNSWNRIVIDYFNNEKCHFVDIKGNIVTALFFTPKKDNIENVIFHAAYICSLLDLFNSILRRKNIKTFDIGIGISTDQVHFMNFNDYHCCPTMEGTDLKSILLALDAGSNGFERILIDSCTQHNVSNLVCYDDKKYSEVGQERKTRLLSSTVYGYNLNLIAFTEWIDQNCKDEDDDK